jgi:hypothetical protein
LPGVTLRFHHNERWHEENGVSALVARPHVGDDRFALLMGDHVFDWRVLELMLGQQVADGESLLAIDCHEASPERVAEATKVRLDGDRIIAIGKQVSPFDALDTGVFVFSSSIFAALEESAGRRRHVVERRRPASGRARPDARRRFVRLRVVGSRHRGGSGPAAIFHRQSAARLPMRVLRGGALVLGIALFAAAVARFDVDALARMSGSLTIALPVVILINGLSQVLRTLTWRFCFPPGVMRPFRRLLRVRLAAEAFSYVTVSGVAGEPLKVILLKDEAPAAAGYGLRHSRTALVLHRHAGVGGGLGRRHAGHHAAATLLA